MGRTRRDFRPVGTNPRAETGIDGLARRHPDSAARPRPWWWTLPPMRRLRGRFLVITVALTVTAIATVLGAAELYAYRHAQAALRAQLVELFEAQRAVLTRPVWNLDVDRINAVLAAIADDPDVLGAAVYDAAGVEIAGIGVLQPPAADLLRAGDIVFGPDGQVAEVVGRFVVAMSDARLVAAVRRDIVVGGAVAMSVMATAILSNLLALRWTVERPLGRLLEAIYRTKVGRGRREAVWDSPDEMGRVIRAFNRLQRRVGARETATRLARDALERRLSKRTQEAARARDELAACVLELEWLQADLADQASQVAQMSEDLSLAKQQLHETVESISEGFALWDSDDRLLMYNRHYHCIFPDLTDLIVPGVNFADFVRAAYGRGILAPEQLDTERAVAERLRRHRTSSDQFEQELSDGRWIRVSKRRTKSGHVIGILSDISDRVESQATIQRMAVQDALTGLPNRARFHDDLRHAIGHADRIGTRVGVMLLDLDHFKSVNDTHGHAAGDGLLRQVAKRVLDCLRKTDSVARLGGDEFAVIATNADQASGIQVLGDRIANSLAEPFEVDGNEIHTGASIGVTIYPNDPGDSEQLLRNANFALYRAKEEGRGTCQIFDRQMHAVWLQRRALEQDLRGALERDELYMVYQPQIDLASGEIVGAECLIRWQHPERGSILPGDFISVAETTRLIIPIGEWVLRTACRQFALWRSLGLLLPNLSVNISPLHFQQENLADQVQTILAASGLDPHYLELEITEGMALAATDATLRVLAQLKAVGVRLAIDDFGTGYSSLNRIKNFPVDRLKIDKSFIRHAVTDPSDAAISAAIIHLGHTLNLSVIAEGAEQREQIDFLIDQGCDQVQGYFISPPLAAAEFAAFVSAYEPSTWLQPPSAATRAPIFSD